MANSLLKLAYEELKRKKLDAYYLTLSNENLYEFTMPIDNLLYEYTGFSGDTGALLITKGKSFLYVDGRFDIQAKNEINDKTIKIVVVNKMQNKISDITERLTGCKRIALNPKVESTKFVTSLNEKLSIDNIKIVYNYDFLSKKIKSIKNKLFNMSSAPLFLLDSKCVGISAKTKIKYLISKISNEYSLSNNIYYLTSNLEEIAYVTNLRYRLCDINNHGVLFKAFMIIGANKSLLYTNDYLEDSALKYASKNNIEIRKYDDFYNDIKGLKNKIICFDKNLNNYYIYKILLKNKHAKSIKSPLLLDMSVKGDKEITNLRRCNLIDGIAMTKVLYRLKRSIYGYDQKAYNTEYKIKKYVDGVRKQIGKKYYLCPSFETIVAYKENSAICHYTPRKNNDKKITYNSLLLIDSGGDYLFGTTDITRTISLYKKKIPIVVKKHYSMVLNSVLKLSILRFPYGLTGSEIDIIARNNLYYECLDFEHGTGHGIGYISNVHEGPNRIGPGINKNYENNVLEPYQLTSNEPGLYFEGKYGIRIENDILTMPYKSNSLGDFLKFETLTICPYDRDLIDKKYLDDDSIEFLNKYNKFVYNKLSKHLTDEECKWLKKETREV